MKITSMDSKVLARAFSASGYVEWTVVIDHEVVSGIPFRAEIVSNDERPFVMTFEPIESGTDFDYDDDECAWVVTQGGKQVAALSDTEWLDVQAEAKATAQAAVERVEAAKYAAVKAIIEGEVGA